MADRINTSKTLSNDGYFSGVDYSSNLSLQTMNIAPVMEDLYDYAFTEDIVLLNERKDTLKVLYQLFIDSVYAKKYLDSSNNIIKIPKDDILEIFYYFKDKLLEIKQLTPYEYVIAINEFFDFNYDYVANKVLSPKIKTAIIEDYYRNGMKKRIEEGASEKLF